MAKKQEASPTKPKKTVKKKRKSYATRGTKAELIRIEERRNLVVKLALQGASIRQISSQLKASGIAHSSLGTISNDLSEALKERSLLRIPDTGLLVELELEKIDSWEVDLNILRQELREGKIFTKDKVEDLTKIINSLKNVQNQRDRFQSLSKREKSKIDAREALAKLAGIPVEQIPNKDGAK